MFKQMKKSVQRLQDFTNTLKLEIDWQLLPLISQIVQICIPPSFSTLRNQKYLATDKQGHRSPFNSGRYNKIQKKLSLEFFKGGGGHEQYHPIEHDNIGGTF